MVQTGGKEGIGMSDKPRVYLCGPITGLSYNQARYGWRKTIYDLLSPDIEVFSPLRQEGHLSEVQRISHKDYPENPITTGRGIVAKDLLDVRQSDLIIANLKAIQIDPSIPEEEVERIQAASVGSIAEISWSYILNKPVLLIIEATGNVHDKLFLTEQVSWRTDNVEQAAEMARALLLPGV